VLQAAAVSRKPHLDVVDVQLADQPVAAALARPAPIPSFFHAR
jgi:hypothetical protein